MGWDGLGGMIIVEKSLHTFNKNATTGGVVAFLFIYFINFVHTMLGPAHGEGAIIVYCRSWFLRLLCVFACCPDVRGCLMLMVFVCCA